MPRGPAAGRRARLRLACGLALAALCCAAGAWRPAAAPRPRGGRLGRGPQGFVPGPPRRRGAELGRGAEGASRGPVAAALAGAAPHARAEAPPPAAEGGWDPSPTKDFFENARRFFRLLTTGADDVYDPTTPEGAKALGLANVMPKQEEFAEVTTGDYLPVVGIFAFAVVYGVFIVPMIMDRSDGAKSVFFKPETGDDAGPRAPEPLKQQSETAALVDSAKTPKTLLEERMFTPSKSRQSPGGFSMDLDTKKKKNKRSKSKRRS